MLYECVVDRPWQSIHFLALSTVHWISTPVRCRGSHATRVVSRMTKHNHRTLPPNQPFRTHSNEISIEKGHPGCPDNETKYRAREGPRTKTSFGPRGCVFLALGDLSTGCGLSFFQGVGRSPYFSAHPLRDTKNSGFMFPTSGEHQPPRTLRPVRSSTRPKQQFCLLKPNETIRQQFQRKWFSVSSVDSLINLYFNLTPAYEGVDQSKSWGFCTSVIQKRVDHLGH